MNDAPCPAPYLHRYGLDSGCYVCRGTGRVPLTFAVEYALLGMHAAQGQTRHIYAVRELKLRHAPDLTAPWVGAISVPEGWRGALEEFTRRSATATTTITCQLEDWLADNAHNYEDPRSGELDEGALWHAASMHFNEDPNQDETDFVTRFYAWINAYT